MLDAREDIVQRAMKHLENNTNKRRASKPLESSAEFEPDDVGVVVQQHGIFRTTSRTTGMEVFESFTTAQSYDLNSSNTFDQLFLLLGTITL